MVVWFVTMGHEKCPQRHLTEAASSTTLCPYVNWDKLVYSWMQCVGPEKINYWTGSRKLVWIPVVPREWILIIQRTLELWTTFSIECEMNSCIWMTLFQSSFALPSGHNENYIFFLLTLANSFFSHETDWDHSSSQMINHFLFKLPTSIPLFLPNTEHSPSYHDGMSALGSQKLYL